MYAICNAHTKAVVSNARFETMQDAMIAAQKLAVELKITTKPVNISTAVKVRKPVVMKVDHNVYMVLGKKDANKTRKVLKVGTMPEIQPYITWFLNTKHYSPVIVRHSGAALGSRV